MELIERVRQALARDYGITSDEELMAAIEKQQPLDIGIFVSSCGQDFSAAPRKRASEI